MGVLRKLTIPPIPRYAHMEREPLNCYWLLYLSQLAGTHPYAGDQVVHKKGCCNSLHTTLRTCEDYNWQT